MKLKPKITITCLTAISITGIIYAQNGGINLLDLKQLKIKWQKAITKANKPINEKYKIALKKMEQNYTKQGNLDKALEVRKEYDWVANSGNKPEQVKEKLSSLQNIKLGKTTIKNIKKPVLKRQIIGTWTYAHAVGWKTEFTKRW